MDESGALDGVVFMPEMLEHVGRRFTVEARVERACDTINKGGSVRRMPKGVLLDDLRCDGAGHGGCDAGCRLYWREEWLRRVRQDDPAPVPTAETGGLETLARANTTREAGGGRVYRCQATDFVRATEELGWWDARSFLRELTCRNVGLGRFLAVCLRILVEETRERLGLWWRYPVRREGRRGDPAVTLGLRPGAEVVVRAKEEIFATLDQTGKDRGLWFDREMLPYCGTRQLVKKRVRRFVDEGTGTMVELKSDCLILDGVVCQGHLSRGRWFCPRAIYPWWREAWLRPADGPPGERGAPLGHERRGTGSVAARRRTAIRLFVRPSIRSRWISASGKSRRRSAADRSVISSHWPRLCHPSVKRALRAFFRRRGRNWKNGSW